MSQSGKTRSQVASALGVSEKTLYSWEKEGWIPEPERDSRGWRRYTAEQINAIRTFLQNRHPTRTAQRPSSSSSSSSRISQDDYAISARNHLRGIVKSISADGVLAEVVLDLGHGNEIVSVITRGSVERLGLRVGEPAVALIKATEVLLAR